MNDFGVVIGFIACAVAVLFCFNHCETQDRAACESKPCAAGLQRVYIHPYKSSGYCLCVGSDVDLEIGR